MASHLTCRRWCAMRSCRRLCGWSRCDAHAHQMGGLARPEALPYFLVVNHQPGSINGKLSGKAAVAILVTIAPAIGPRGQAGVALPGRAQGKLRDGNVGHVDLA